jgi:hypothetical protein
MLAERILCVLSDAAYCGPPLMKAKASGDA